MRRSRMPRRAVKRSLTAAQALTALAVGSVLMGSGYLLPFPIGPVVTITGIVCVMATVWHCGKLEW